MITARPLSNTAARRGQRHDDRDLPWPRTNRGDQQCADADSGAGPDHQPDRSTQPLADCHIDGDDGGNRREQRRVMPEEMHGHEPGEAGGQGRLGHRDGNASPTTQSPRKVLANA